jgi:type I restriction enzyme M protein
VSAAPAVDDGQLLFLMEMVSKMKRLQDSPAGSRIATVHNGSALFTGNAGGGASNIRQYLMEIAGKLHQQLGEKMWDDFSLFTEDVKAAIRKLKLKPGAPQLKAILDAVSWRDPEAAPIIASELYLEIDTQEQRLAARTWYPVVEDGSATIYEPDAELRDTENIPLTYEGGIEAYFHKEVLPHVPDAWIDDSKTVIGYEISFNKYFYVHQPLRDLAEVVKEIRDLEAETEGLLEQILSFSN